MRRRTFLHLSASLPLAVRQGVQSKPRVVVVGAGAFGGWTALMLLRRGCHVTLVDAWGPANSRASSGGETRVIRGVYGANRVYVEMAMRAFELWREHAARVGQALYHRTGALWMVASTGADDSLERASMPLLREAGLQYDELSVTEARARYPQIAFDGIRWALFEHEAGFLLARRACATVVDAFRAEGGEYVESRVAPLPEAVSGKLLAIGLPGEGLREADAFVFACGPWLGEMFPDLLGARIRPTRQEVFFFGTPDGRFGEERMPVWIEHGAALFYGVPGNEWRGFKVADDTRGEPVDPTTMERMPSREGLANARALLARRFPALKDAPVVETRVCQYENSPDEHFIIDRHPKTSNVWIAGGGSGHGFKFGPAIGEHVADLVLGRARVKPQFSLARFGHG